MVSVTELSINMKTGVTRAAQVKPWSGAASCLRDEFTQQRFPDPAAKDRQ